MVIDATSRAPEKETISLVFVALIFISVESAQYWEQSAARAGDDHPEGPLKHGTGWCRPHSI